MARAFSQSARDARQRLLEVELDASEFYKRMRSRVPGTPPGFLYFPVREEMIEKVGQVTQRTAQRAAKPHPADKGTLGKGIRLEFLDEGWAARVDLARSIAGVGFTIEYGRRPGRRPPYSPIKRWLISHGIISGARGESGRVQEIREEIRGRGTKGVYFMRQAQEVAEKALREGIPRTEREIRAAWERPPA